LLNGPGAPRRAAPRRQFRLEVSVPKKMIGVGMRSFFNYTTPIPEDTKNAALRSGKERFHGYRTPRRGKGFALRGGRTGFKCRHCDYPFFRLLTGLAKSYGMQGYARSTNSDALGPDR
jgi:hypothetical protein